MLHYVGTEGVPSTDAHFVLTSPSPSTFFYSSEGSVPSPLPPLPPQGKQKTLTQGTWMLIGLYINDWE